MTEPVQPNQTNQPKETKAQRTERLKKAKNPWEAFDEVRAFAREGRASVVPEWAGMYFKWWGVYTQGADHQAQRTTLSIPDGVESKLGNLLIIVVLHSEGPPDVVSGIRWSPFGFMSSEVVNV